jgi:hypothetical protein
MTIFATHFAVVLGAWRLRVRVDLDEPRESELGREAPDDSAPPRREAPARPGNDGWAALPWDEARFAPPGYGSYDRR